MATWQKVKLADCVNLLAGFPFKSQQFTDKPDDLPLVKGENVSQGCILWDISKRWPALDWDKMAKFHLLPGDVVIAMDRPWIPAGLKWSFIRTGDPKALLVQRCARLRSSNARLDQNFLRFVIGSPGFEGYVKPITTGVNVPHISGQQILDYEFMLPPLPEQRRIAGILCAYDELMENSQRRIRILEAMARALYREWFVQFRFPGHEKLYSSPSGRGRGEGAQLVSSLLGDIPQGWEVRTLGEIAEDMRRNVPKGILEEPKPYVGLEHIPRRSLALDAWETATELGSNKLEFKKGEVLFGKIRPYFHKVSVAPFDGLCSADTIVIRSRRPDHYAVVVACVSSDAFVAEASATANGAKMPRANWDVLEKYQVVIPKGKVAEKFSALFADIIAQQQALIFQIQNLRRTRDLLLPRLLSGQVELSTAEVSA
ncbi:MAG: restriction endonuclease subunit S [Verrucomicrobiota bacterium]